MKTPKVMEFNSESDLLRIKRSIQIAREWARKHFNMDREHDTRLFNDDSMTKLAPPAFYVEFPKPDEMLVTPSLMGLRSSIMIHYRLHFGEGGRLIWRDTRGALPPLEVDRNVIDLSKK